MIELKKITTKNFLSYGNVPTELNLNSAKTTLVIGKNGCGKSALQSDAITYALYGKPFRKINLPQLINSINDRDCEVTVEFSSEGKEYKVVRGMKPAKFEIYEQGKLLDKEAATRDYQGYLEKNILKVSLKTFTQSTILGSATFTPFMQLTTGARREIVEDILDIGVFAKMNRLLKERIASTKMELMEIEANLRAAKSETVAQKKVIEILKSTKGSRVAEIDQEIVAIKTGIKTLTESLIEAREKLSGLSMSEPPDVFSEHADLKSDISGATRKLESIEAEISRVDTLENCECCFQKVTSKHRKVILEKLEASKSNIEQELLLMNEKLTALSQQVEVHYEWELEVVEAKNDIARLLPLIANSETRIESLSNKQKAIEAESGDIVSETEKLTAVAERALKLLSRKNELVLESDIQQVSTLLLKDSGIKSTIVEKYLPILNNFINKYLSEFDFFINFALDENFGEEIRSRGRDVFSYSNFSEGEKKKIDVAILLAFRQIAAMKNSAKINLLLTDEIENGLDQQSLEKFIEILAALPDTNTFIISHALADNQNINATFDSVMQVTKVGDFSSVTRT